MENDLILVNDFEEKIDSLKNNFDKKKLKSGDEIKIYHLNSLNHLNQFIGYAKYINKKRKVFLRGQTFLPSEKDCSEKLIMTPSLYRPIEGYNSTNENKYKHFCQLLSNNKKKGLKFSHDLYAALVQHYGIKTNQIDVVDNIWVALWFASHTCDSIILHEHEYIKYKDTENAFGYIYLLATDAISPTNLGGVYEGDDTKLVDIREAIPSQFLRPHAQHAYMISKQNKISDDYTDLICGIAEINTNLIFKWLGNNRLLSTETLFPAPNYDYGYATLLKKFKMKMGEAPCYGSIQVVL